MNKITQEHIDATIVSKTFIVLPDGVTTICQLILKNGFSVLGSSACVDPANFNLQMGRDIAFKNAQDKVWQLEGYLLKEEMFKLEKAHAADKQSADYELMKNLTAASTASEAKQILAAAEAAPKAAKSANAPWGYKKDGTPRGKPGRKA